MSEGFDLEIVDSVEDLEAKVRTVSDEGRTSRLVAGFCWPWSEPMPDGTLVNDVKLGDWSMPWNAKADTRRLARGIPRSEFWVSDAAGVDQVGCVYTAQGFEFEHVGVIWDRDLVYRGRDRWVAQPEFSKTASCADQRRTTPTSSPDS